MLPQSYYYLVFKYITEVIITILAKHETPLYYCTGSLGWPYLSVCPGYPLPLCHDFDTHIGSSTAQEDLERTVQDINAQTDIAFVMISGDITEFGSDEELHLAKQVLDRFAEALAYYSGQPRHQMV